MRYQIQPIIKKTDTSNVLKYQDSSNLSGTKGFSKFALESHKPYFNNENEIPNPRGARSNAIHSSHETRS